MLIKWLTLALADIEQIEAYIYKDNSSTANKVIQLIYNNIQYLLKHPDLGRPGRVPNTRELIIENTSYLVPYRVRENEIQILRILHSSMKWPDDF